MDKPGLRPGASEHRLVRDSLKVARVIIVEKIDREGKFEPGSIYEVTGQQLREYLAFAYREGRTAPVEVSP